ncbi:MAG: acetylornithine/succinylornithine family transaminase [Clostridia bacterium]|nr:acetylornithine/succinylornithine family transaminase [Clostridia bacterium]
MNAIERDNEYIVGTYGRFPLEIESGKGSIALGADGKSYVDMGAGIAVNTFGYADDVMNAAITAQLAKVQHTSNLYYSEPCTLLAEALSAKAEGLKKVFFGNSGAEANECAIKTARKWGKEHKGAACNKIVTLVSSFHGRTVTTLSATGQDVFHKNFDPFTPGFLYVPANDVAALEKAIDDTICAVMVEFVQGEGGVNVLDPAFVKGLFELKKQKNFLVIADEVQTGNGRTGKYFAYQHYGVLPDLVTTAKGLGGGLPIGACLFAESTASVLGKGDHGSTFGGNPVVAAGALSVVKRIDDALLKEVAEKGAHIKSRLEGAEGVLSVTGIGLMIGVEVVPDAKKVVAKCLEKGAMFLTAKTKVRLLPALNISYPLIDRAIDILLAAIKESL